MTRSEVIDLVHIDGTGEYLFSPALADADMDWIDANPSIVEPIVAARKNPAGFLISFPTALEQILSHEKTPMLSIDLETTHLTKHSPAIKMNSKSHIGGKPYSAHLARFPKSTIDTTPRIRVLAIHAIGGPCSGEYVFDLDAMPAADRQRLIDTVLDGHVLVGHNVIGFDGFWLFQESIKRPLMWLDTLMLTRLCKPEMLTYLNYDAARGDEERASVAIAALHKRGGEGGASLEYLAQSLGLPALNKTYQNPENWCISILSPEHLAYVLSDIHTPIQILKHIFGTLDLDEIKRQIRERCPWYVTYMRAASITARTKGVPFSEAEAVNLTAEKRTALASAVEEMRQFPEFGDDAVKVLADPERSSTSKVVLKALGDHAAAHDLVLPKTEKGGISISGKAMTLAGLTETLPCWRTLSKINNEKKGIGMIEQYRKYAKQDGRLHCMVQFITAAGRASCSEPNLQGTPREPALRGLAAADQIMKSWGWITAVSSFVSRRATLSGQSAGRDRAYSIWHAAIASISTPNNARSPWP